MKKGVVIGIIIIIILLIIGGFFIFNYNESNEIPLDQIPFEEQSDYTGEQTTIMHKDFKTIISVNWTEIESIASPTYSSFIYLLKNTSESDVNVEAIFIDINYIGENPNYTIEGLLEKGIESTKKIMPDFNLTNAEEWNNNYFSGKKIKYTGTSKEIKRKFTQTAGIKFDQLYTITYSCPENNCNSYPIYNYLIKTFEPVKAKKIE